MQNIKLIFRIILPSIICLLCLHFIIDELFYYPLVFGLIIGIANWNLHRYKLYLGLLLSVLLSYITFFISFFSYAFLGKLFDFIEVHIKLIESSYSMREIAFIISPFIIAPLLVFFAYKYAFHIPKTKLTLLIKIISIIMLVLIGVLFNDYNKDSLLNPFILWQVVMALGLQLILYQKELKRFFYKNK